jgi:hypothetical protein
MAIHHETTAFAFLYNFVTWWIKFIFCSIFLLYGILGFLCEPVAQLTIFILANIIGIAPSAHFSGYFATHIGLIFYFGFFMLKLLAGGEKKK